MPSLEQYSKAISNEILAPLHSAIERIMFYQNPTSKECVVLKEVLNRVSASLYFMVLSLNFEQKQAIKDSSKETYAHYFFSIPNLGLLTENFPRVIFLHDSYFHFQLIELSQKKQQQQLEFFKEDLATLNWYLEIWSDK